MPTAGPGPDETGTVMPASTSSVWGVVSVNTSPNPGAAASRAVSVGRFQHQDHDVLHRRQPAAVSHPDTLPLAPIG
jgi:hypothetical protein